MIKYKKIELTDYGIINNILQKHKADSCDHCFYPMYIWSFHYTVEFAIKDNTLFMRALDKNTYWYLAPIGDMEFEKAIEEIIKQGKSDNKNISIFALDTQQKYILENQIEYKFEIHLDRDGADYIYKTEDLSFLKGKKYQKKRNHCSRFERENPGYVFKVIDQESIEKIKEFEIQWCKDNELKDIDGITSEEKGILSLLDNYSNTDMLGAYIEKDGKVIAFTLAAPINENMVDIVVEKAIKSINGAYAVINRDFAKNCLQKYELINREDDMGYENLRKAKLSYYPYEIKEKYIANFKIH